MKQERLRQALAWAESCPSENTRQTFRPIRYALRKQIEKPMFKDKTRFRCPDCGAGIRKTDTYCFRCGQKLTAKRQRGSSQIRGEKR